MLFFYPILPAVRAGSLAISLCTAAAITSSPTVTSWTAYEGFLGEIDEECEVSIHVEAFLYGEGETFRASLEEVAYM